MVTSSPVLNAAYGCASGLFVGLNCCLYLSNAETAPAGTGPALTSRVRIRSSSENFGFSWISILNVGLSSSPRRIGDGACSSSFLILSRDTGRADSGFLSLSSCWVDEDCSGEDDWRVCVAAGPAQTLAVRRKPVM